MISRVADGCFWLTRYLERVDSLARLLDVHHALHIDSGVASRQRWRPLVVVAGEEADFLVRIGADALEDGEAVQEYLTWDTQHPSALFSAVRGARENARSVREIMSLEAWEAINDLWLWMRGREARRLYQRNRAAFYERLIQSTVLFHGVAYGTMLHDEPFSFMKLGRAVERAGQTARIVGAHGPGDDAGTDAGAEATHWLAVLRSCCAFDPFFRGARPLRRDAVIRFLVFDRSFPRSVLYNLDEARTLLWMLRRDDPRGMPRRSRSALERLRGELLQMDVADVERRGLRSTLAWVVDSTAQLCDAIHDDYLDPPMAWLRHCVRVLESLEPDLESDLEPAPGEHRAA
ncbi:MAG: alpha-E domain-containing protein [Myxococcota bacterium]